jgi:hypothetical protein
LTGVVGGGYIRVGSRDKEGMKPSFDACSFKITVVTFWTAENVNG